LKCENVESSLILFDMLQSRYLTRQHCQYGWLWLTVYWVVLS